MESAIRVETDPDGTEAQMIRQYYVYILCNAKASVNYTGVTSDLARRTYEHKNKLVKGFAEKYNADRLVYFETYDEIYTALTREKEIKSWRREKKMNLIRSSNPGFKDLYNDIT